MENIKSKIRNKKIKKNIYYLLVIKGLSIVTSLVIVPITVNYVNPEKYGIWLTLSSIILWFSYFDIGIANGLRNKFTEAKTNLDYMLARKYVSTTYFFLTVIFGGLLILFTLFFKFLDWNTILNAEFIPISELQTLSLIVFSFFCIQFILKTISIILIADQKNSFASFLDLFGQIISLLILYILTLTTKGSLIKLALGISIGPLLVLSISSISLFRYKYIKFRPTIKFVNIKYFKDIFKLGTKFFILQIGALVIYQTTIILISQLHSPYDVTVFNLSYKYFSILLMIITIIIAPFWSAFTESYTLNDYKWMRKTIKNLRIAFILTLVLGVIMIFSSDLFFKIWLGNKVIIPTKISISILVNILTMIWCMIHIHPINGIGKLKIQLYISLFEIIINIPLAIILNKHFGIIGIIITPVFSQIPRIIIAPIQLNKLISKKATGIWNT